MLLLLVGKKALCCDISPDVILRILKLWKIYSQLSFTKKLFQSKKGIDLKHHL